MKKLVVILVAFVTVLAVGIYLILPTNIKWNEYVRQMSEDVHTRTGLTLKIKGNPTFSMKSSPILKVDGVQLSNIKDASYPELMTADHAEILFDMKSLFRRKIKVKKITLFSPHFYFETMPNGKWNWQIAFFDRAGKNSTIGFESLLAIGGKANVKYDKYTEAGEWDRVNAELLADSMEGPFFLEGNVAALSSSFGFSLKVEKYQNGQSPDFTLRLINAPAEASFVFTGKYGLSEIDRGMLIGGLTFDVRKPDQFFALLYPQEKLPQELFQPLVGNLQLNKTPQTRTTVYDDILFQYGASLAKGRLTVRSLSPEEASVVLAEQEATEPEEEIILRDPKNPSEEIRLETSSVSKTKLAHNLLPKIVDGSFIFSKFDADPFFKNLPVVAQFMSSREYFTKTKDTYSLKLAFDAVNLKKDVIHQMNMRVLSKPEGLGFENFSATLPGNAYISGDATLDLDKKTRLTGKLSVDASNITAVLNWLDIPMPEEIPQNLMRQFKIGAGFKLSPETFVLEQSKGSLDKNSFSGNVFIQNGNKKMAVLTTDISTLNLSDYFPASSKSFVQQHEEFLNLSVKEKLKRFFSGLAVFKNWDFNVRLTTNSLSWGNIKTGNIRSNFSITNGAVDIRDFKVNGIFASDISLQGGVSGFDSILKFDDFSVVAEARQLSSLSKALGISVKRTIAPRDKLSASAHLTGTLEMMEFETSLKSEAIDFKGKGSFKEMALDEYDWDMETDLFYDNFRNFIQMFSTSYRPVLANPGEIRLKARLSKTKDMLSLTDMNVHLGMSDLSGFIKFNNQEKRVEADFSGESLAPLGILPKVNFVENLSIDTQKEIPVNVLEKNGLLSVIETPVSFSRKPFDLSFLGDYDANISIKTNNLFLNSLHLSDFDGIIKLSKEKVVLDIRRSLWNKANFGGVFNLIPEKDELSVRSALRLSNINIPQALFDSPSLDLGNIEAMVLNVNIGGKGKTAEALMQSLMGTGKMSFEKADLLHFDMNRLKEELANKASASEEASKDVLAGKTPLTKFETEVRLNKGIFTTNLASFLYNESKNTSFAFMFDFLKKTLSANISFPVGVQAVPDVSFALNKKSGEPTLVSQNVSDVIRMAKMMQKRLQDKELQDRLIQKRKDEQKQREIHQGRMNRIKALEEKVAMASMDLAKKSERMHLITSKVYQAHKYLLVLDNAKKTLASLEALVRKAKQQAATPEGISDRAIDSLEEKIKREYFDKESEINDAYNSSMTLGYKGAVFNVVNKGNNMLLQANKTVADYPALPELSQKLDQIKERIKRLQEIQSESEKDGLVREDFIALSGQAEAEVSNIKSIHDDMLNAIAAEKAKIKAEEQAKKEAEEAKMKAEEEAKLAAEKVKQEAERQRQRTIVRTGGGAAVSVKTEGTAKLQVLSTEEQKKDDDNQADSNKNGNSMIIRRR